MFDFAGKNVLITGSSGGIGAALAARVAAKGARLVLVARNRARLDAVAGKLEHDHKTRVLVVAEDLGQPGAPQRVREAVQNAGLAIDVLINNAGIGNHGRYEEMSLTVQREMIDLNVTALLEMTCLFLPELLERRGGIINVASIGAFQPLPFMAVYGASKAFVLSFSEALWGEYRKRALRVLALCPGATETAFFERSGDIPGTEARASPDDVARIGLAAFDKNRSFVVHGFRNYVASQASRFFPRAMTAKLTAALTAPKPPSLPASSPAARALGAKE